MRYSKRKLRGVAMDCALRHETQNQMKNSGKLLQATLYVCNNLFINCSLFDLASTCSTYCRKIFKKFVFLASPKTRVVTNFLPSHRPFLHARAKRGRLLARWRSTRNFVVIRPLEHHGPSCSSGLVTFKPDAAQFEGSSSHHLSLLLG